MSGRTVHLNQFQRDAAAMAADAPRRAFLRDSLRGYESVRARTQAAFQDWELARDLAAAAKWNAIDHLDEHLASFAAHARSRGTHVHWASDAAEAREIILSIIRAANARSIVKSKTMTSEEIHLNDALEREGFEVVESDLGEYIVQLRGEGPSHFVFPAMHLKRGEIARLFRDTLGTRGDTDDPEALTMIARRALRDVYLRADVGITGANFLVADTGMISITENEGNARLTNALPAVHIAIVGIEKVIPSMDDLALLLPMLATCGTGQHLTCYNTLIAGPKRDDEPDGPEEFHVVVLDNGRTRLLADAHLRDSLRCIRCGACLNVCPVFRGVGGHAYGSVYQGPIGAVITPHLEGMKEWSHLSSASSLCGACTSTCPVKIDLHHHLLRNRRLSAEAHGGWRERLLMRGFAFVMVRPRAYRWFSRLGRVAHALARPIFGTRLDPLRGWRSTRDLPDPAKQPFHQWWRERTDRRAQNEPGAGEERDLL
jgi:L-lactate dehydrogenase complex protein LldF